MAGPRLRARAFVHATEDPAKVEAALLWTLGLGATPDEKGRIRRSRVKGHHGNPIDVLEVTLAKAKDLQRFRAGFTADDAAERLRAELAERLDGEGVVRFRLEKQEAVARRLVLTRTSDAIQLEAHFPRLPGRPALEAARAFFQAPIQ